jgi:hypothetical protein
MCVKVRGERRRRFLVPTLVREHHRPGHNVRPTRARASPAERDHEQERQTEAAHARAW